MGGVKDIAQSRQFEALRRWNHVMLSVTVADHYLARLERTPISSTVEEVFDADGLLLAFCVSYARPFGEAAKGFPRLNRNTVFLDERCRSAHDNILLLRHKRYAHAGGSHGEAYDLGLVEVAGGLRLEPAITLEIPGTLLPEFRAAFDALQAYTYDRTHSACEALARAFGINVEFPSGPPPAHKRDK